MVKPCWRTLLEGAGGWRRGDRNRPADALLWHKELGHHLHGEFSMAMIQANAVLEDQSRLESGPLSWLDPCPLGTFVGVYDGHGGAEASRFANDSLFTNLKRLVADSQKISESVLKAAFLETDQQFLSMVRQQWLVRPQIASTGTCCLVGVISDGLLYVANAGDSRAVLGRTNEAGEATAIQLSTEHNANLQTVRNELHALHPDDPHIVTLKHKVWRVKGLIQVSRSIGDAYLKDPEFNREPLLAKFRLSEPFSKPILSAEPAILVHELIPRDHFVIFASDGLWEHLGNQEAVDIVNSYPRRGIACRLVKAALRVAARKREMQYTDLKKIDRGVRRHFHDDITAVVVFIDQASVRTNCSSSVVSITGGESVV